MEQQFEGVRGADTLDIASVREDFPFFAAQDTAYLDNSATSLCPECVIRTVSEHYLREKASPFRGLYPLSVQITEAYEAARETVRGFINAPEAAEVIFTRNASESLNLIAYSLGSHILRPGDEVLVGITEHHSNMLPWRMAAERTGAKVRYLLCEPDGTYREETLREALNGRTKILAITHCSNVFGRVNDLRRFAELCHANGTLIVADGAQSVPHMPVDVQELGVDFLVFSGHKMLTPMGIGVLWGRRALLEEMPPFLTGGEMIDAVTTDEIWWAPLPQKFEAGTVNTGGALALAEAIRYLGRVGFDRIQKREADLTRMLVEGILDTPHVRLIGSQDPAEHHGIAAFTVEGVHPHDISAIMSDGGVCIRAGHHCAQPLHQHLGIPSSSRASVMFYNTEEEIGRFLTVLRSIRGAMGYAE